MNVLCHFLALTVLVNHVYSFRITKLSPIRTRVVTKVQSSLGSPEAEIPEPYYPPPPQGGNIMTLSRFMIEATRDNVDHGDFESLVDSIQIACKTIASLVATSGVMDLTGSNPSTKESLYDSATNVMKNALRFTGKLGMVAAESDDLPLLVEEAWNSKYLAVFDPLDGALNIDVGIVTGTVFGIFKEQEECLTDFGEEVGNRGKEKLLKSLLPENIVAAGYCMYSSCTVMMFSMGEGEYTCAMMQCILYTSSCI